jgi:hypothetical protein
MVFMSKLLRNSCLLLVGIVVAPIANGQLCQNQVCFTACGDGGDSSVAAGKCRSSENKDKLAALRNPKLILADFKPSETQATPVGTIFLFWPGSASDPLALLSVTHDADHDLLSDGTLRNQGTSNLLAYRIGWLVFSHSQTEPKLAQGSLIELKKPVTLAETASVGPRGVSPTLLQSDPSLIVFFVAEAQFSDGTKWKASIPAIQAKYQ